MKKISKDYGREILCFKCDIPMKKLKDDIYECPKCGKYTAEGVEYGSEENTEEN